MRPSEVTPRLPPSPITLARIGEVRLAEDVERACTCEQCLGAQVGFGVRRQLEQSAEPHGALLRVTHDPVRLQGDGELETAGRISACGPIEDGPHVVDLGRDEIEVPGAEVDDAASSCPVGECVQAPELGVTQCILLAGRVEPLERELPDRLEHPEALLAVRIGAAADEALVEQRRQRVEVGAADLLRVLEGGAAAEHREPREERLLFLAEQVVAPRDRRAQRGVAFVGVATALEKVEPLPDPLEELLRAEQLDPRGGELDRERQTVEAADQLAHGRRVTDVARGLPARARGTT